MYCLQNLSFRQRTFLNFTVYFLLTKPILLKYSKNQKSVTEFSFLVEQRAGS